MYICIMYIRKEFELLLPILKIAGTCGHFGILTLAKHDSSNVAVRCLLYISIIYI